MRSVVVGILLLLIAVPAAAQISMDRVVIGSGGGTMSNGPLRLDLTIGQPAAGVALSGTLEGDFGFWWQVPSSLVAVDKGQAPPVQYTLSQNAPNPFHSSTVINYAIPAGPQVPVFIGVFSVQGGLLRTLVNSSHGPGQYQVPWDGRRDDGIRLAAGLYFLQIKAGPFQRMRKTVLLP